MRHNITFIISNLRVGGAEMMLYKLLSKINRDLFSPSIISLNDDVPMAGDFADIDVPVSSVGIDRAGKAPRGFFRLLQTLHSNNPDIVQTWMYHADLLGGLGARTLGRRPIIWNIRHSNLDKSADSRATLLTARTCARLSRVVPTYIVCCSETAKGIHEKIGYDPAKIVVIPNGFDLSRFSPSKKLRSKTREGLGISDETFLIGLVGRYHPQKDHRTFVAAAKELVGHVNGVEFLLCGKGADSQNTELLEMIEAAGLRKVFHLLGFRDDIPAVTSALDLATSSSFCGEGFGNTIGEAMACGVPCVVTDVGDSAMIVGDAGKVVPARQPVELSQAWLKYIHCSPEERRRVGLSARNRIGENFSVDSVADRYQELYLRSLHSSKLH